MSYHSNLLLYLVLTGWDGQSSENKKCHHYYDQEAVLEMIKGKHKNKKKFRYVPLNKYSYYA